MDGSANPEARNEERTTPLTARGNALHARILIVDPDPATRWFYADVLRGAEYDVAEAIDGGGALEGARHAVPDVIVCAARLPRLDTPDLIRALRRDPRLADVPVVQLLGPEATAAPPGPHLSKTADRTEVLQYLRFLLDARGDLVARLTSPRGELKGASTYPWLSATSRLLPNARMTLQCPYYTYEVHLRDGVPRAASRVDPGGLSRWGLSALATFLRETEGQFTVVPAAGEVVEPFTGTFGEIVERACRHGLATPGPAGRALPPAPASAPEPVVRTVPLPMRSPVAPAQATRSEQPVPTVRILRPVQSAPPHHASVGSTPRAGWRGAARSAGVVLVALAGVVLGAWLHAF